MLKLIFPERLNEFVSGTYWRIPVAQAYIHAQVRPRKRRWTSLIFYEFLLGTYLYLLGLAHKHNGTTTL
jgi:hypothetical protein